MRKLLLGAAAALGGYFLFFHKSPRYLGDKAQVGDDVFVPLSTAAGIPGIPGGAGQVVVHVTSTTGNDVLAGPVTGYAMPGSPAFVPLPQASAPISVMRGAVTAILRQGRTVGL